MNRVLRGIFGLKKEEVTGEWRMIHIEEINELNIQRNIFRVSNKEE